MVRAMKLFTCDNCQQTLYFENSRCVNCGETLGYCADLGRLATLRHPVDTDAGVYEIERRQYRQWLHKDVQRAAGKVLVALHIPEDENLVEYLGERDERSNYEALVRGINRRLNRMLGKEDSRGSRNDWTLAELKEARGLITQARQELLQDVKRRLQEREQGKLPF